MRKIVLGVTGGIAAYKSAEIVRTLQERGFRVQVVMTTNAQRFIAPLTFAALTGEKVITDLFADRSATETLDSSIEHIAVAQEADLLLVAPATADALAKFAHGLANDFLSTMQLAFDGPLVVAPAMNTNMWAHPATVENLRTLASRGVRVVEPGAGDLACGMVGPGRLADPGQIVEAVEEALAPRKGDLAGKRVLVTAGPTREAIDPVRYLSNRSSGRMGFALAEAARDRGASVELVLGPTRLEPPSGIEVAHVESAEEMRTAVLRSFEQVDFCVMAAAVADYRMATPSAQKIKKGDGPPHLELEQTPDILRELGEQKCNQVLVGFAAETENLRENAIRKLREKNCDFLVANPVGESGAGTGIDSLQNQGVLLPSSGDPIELARSSKLEMASRIWDAVLASRPLAKAG